MSKIDLLFYSVIVGFGFSGGMRAFIVWDSLISNLMKLVIPF